VVAFKPSTEFLEAWGQIMRMTYRRGFEPMYRCGDDSRRQYIKLTSDAGWGCMIRVGQMMLATALKRHRDQEFCRAPTEDQPLELKFLDDKQSAFSIFRFIEIALGRDVTALPGSAACSPRVSPDGSQIGTSHYAPARQLTKKDAGDWFGPTTISETIAALVEQNPQLSTSFAVYVNVDGMLYEDEVRCLAYDGRFHHSPDLPTRGCSEERKNSDDKEPEDEFTLVKANSVMSADTVFHSPQGSSAGGSPAVQILASGGESTEQEDLLLPPPVIQEDNIASSASIPSCATLRWQRAVLLLFPLQLGLDKKVSKHYASAVLRYFELQSSLGAMGGRPRMAHFFVGRQDSNLLYVDPHVVQPAALPIVQQEQSKGATIECSGAETFKNLPSVQAIPIEHIDSSISLAFYCSCESDLTALIEGLQRIEDLEKDAPVRSEAVRPPELLRPDIHGIGYLGDSSVPYAEDLVLTEFPGESPDANQTSRQSSFDLADESILTEREKETEAAHAAEDMEGDLLERHDHPPNRPTMSVGSAWSSIETPPFQILN
jgi:hypothetical protein